jgi:hypothetical protein
MDAIYDIFRDFPDSGPIWMEAIQGLENAKMRLVNVLELHPGTYFLYDSRAAKIIATAIGSTKTPVPAR